MNNANSFLILSLSAMGLAIIAAFVAITIFYEGDKGLAIAGLVTVAGLIVPQLLTLKSSNDNAVKLEKVDAKLDDNTVKTQDTHDLVDGQMTEFKALLARFGVIEAELAGARGRAAGIDIGREQMGISPADAAALGAAQAVVDAPPDAAPGETADAAARGAADATKP